MPSQRKSRAAKPARPAADTSCTLTRTVERDGRRFGVWSSSLPVVGEPIEEAPCLRIVGRRRPRRRTPLSPGNVMLATIVPLRSASREPSRPLPLCESQLGKLWRKYKATPPHGEPVLHGFIALYGLWSHWDELHQWDKAGCPHVCGR